MPSSWSMTYVLPCEPILCCPCCPYPVETRTHILGCPTRDEARSNFIDSVTATLSKLMTRPAHGTILLDGLAYYFQGGDRLDPKEYPVEFRRLVRQQNKIGWEQVFSGRFSKLWASHQHLFNKANKLLKKKRNGHLWMVAVTTKIWTKSYKIWEERNGVVHGQPPPGVQEHYQT